MEKLTSPTHTEDKMDVDSNIADTIQAISKRKLSSNSIGGNKVTAEVIQAKTLNAGEVDFKDPPPYLSLRDVSAQSSGNAGITAGFIQAKTINIEQVQHLRKPTPDHKSILGRMQSMLRRRYNALRIEGLPWLPEVSFTLEKCYVHLALTDQRTSLELNQIFRPTKSSIKPTRILIEGAAGYGKTTLVYKLCNDWVNKVDYMTCFDLVIVLRLRSFKENFNETLKYIVNVDPHGDINAVLETIDVNAHKTLLVLEGYDEAPDTAVDYLLPILRRDQMEHVTVLVTSRPGKFTSVSVFGSERYEDVREDFSTYLDKKITIVGLLQENQQIFLQKHLHCLKDYSSEKLLTVKTHLDNIVPQDFLACPLFLLMLVVVFRYGDVTQVNSKTDLFKLVFNFIIKRFLNKQKMTLKDDIFSLNHENRPKYLTALKTLGELAIDALEKDRLIFRREELESCDDSKMILDIGLLNPTIEVNDIWNEIYFEPIHKSLFEFVAAYSLWILYQEKPDDFEATLQSKILLRPTQDTAAYSLMYPFLCGLFDSSCDILFKCLTPFTTEYSFWFGSLCFSLQECTLTTDILNSLKPLFPLEWRIPWYDIDKKFSVSRDHQTLLHCALQSGKTNTIRWFLDSPALLPETVEVNILVLVVGEQYSVSSFSASKCGDIHCRELWCDLRTPHSRSEDWENLMRFVAHIKKDTISFILCTTYSYLWLPFIHKSLLDGHLGVSKIKWLHCWMQKKQKRSVLVITKLIQAERLSGLNLLIVPSNVLAPVFDFVRNVICRIMAVPAKLSATQDMIHSACFLPSIIEGCIESDIPKSSHESLVEHHVQKDSKVLSAIKHITPPNSNVESNLKAEMMHNVNPLTSNSNNETDLCQHQVLTENMANAEQISNTLMKVTHPESISSISHIDAVSSHSPTSQKMAENTCVEFGSAAAEFIESLKHNHIADISLQDSSMCRLSLQHVQSPASAPPTLHQNGEPAFGAALEFISSLQSSTSTQNVSAPGSSHEMKETVPSVSFSSSLTEEHMDLLHTDSNTNRTSFNEFPTVASSKADETSMLTYVEFPTTHDLHFTSSTKPNLLENTDRAKKSRSSHIMDGAEVSLHLNQCPSLMESPGLHTEIGSCIKKCDYEMSLIQKSSNTLNLKKQSTCEEILDSECSTSNTCHHIDPGNRISTPHTSVESSLMTTKDFSFLPLSNSWMKVFDDIYRDLPTLLEEVGYAAIFTLENAFAIPAQNSIKVDTTVQSSASIVESHIKALYAQTISFFNNSSFVDDIGKHLFPSSYSNDEFLSKTKHILKLVYLLFSVLNSNATLARLLSHLETISAVNHDDDIKKRAVESLRTLASFLNDSCESASVSEFEDTGSKYDNFLLELRSLLSTLCVINEDARTVITDSCYKNLYTVKTTFSELFHIVLEEFAPYLLQSSEIDTLRTDAFESVLCKLETLCTSILAIIEENTVTWKLFHLMKSILPHLHSVLLLLADLIEHNKEEISVNKNHVESLEDVCVLFCSAISSLVGLSHYPSSFLSKVLKSFVAFGKFFFPAAIFSINTLVQVCESDVNNVCIATAFRDIYEEFFSFLHTCCSNANTFQAYSSNPRFIFEWLMFISPIKFGTSSTHLNLAAANLPSCELQSNDGYDFLPLSQLHFDSLIKTASCSEELRHFSVSNYGTSSLDVYVDVLFKCGKKSWNKLNLTGDIKLCFSGNDTYDITHLDIRTNEDITFGEQLLNCFRSQSFVCNQQLLISTAQANYRLTNNITELNIYLPSLASNVVTLISSMKQLKTLALTLVQRNDKSHSFSVKKVLPIFSSKLKRFELWNVNVNPKVAAIITEAALDYLKQHYLGCLMLHMDVDILRFKIVTSVMREHFKQAKRLDKVQHIMEHPERQLLDIVSGMKLPLRTNMLSTLQLVSMCKPPVWENIFPHYEGFSLKHSMLRTQTATVLNTSESDVAPFVGHQFTVTFKTNQKYEKIKYLMLILLIFIFLVFGVYKMCD